MFGPSLLRLCDTTDDGHDVAMAYYRARDHRMRYLLDGVLVASLSMLTYISDVNESMHPTAIYIHRPRATAYLNLT